MNRLAAADDQTHIHRTLARLRAATALPLAFGGVVNAGMQVQLTQFAGGIAGALRGAVLDPGRGLGGKVVASRRPHLVNDYVASPGISHHYDHIIQAEHLRAMVAVPVVVRREVRGVLYGAVRSAEPLGDRIIQSVVDEAKELEQNLAVRDEIAHRLDRLDQPDGPDRGGRRAGSSGEEATVREAFAELRILAQSISDRAVRERIEAVCAKLAPAQGTHAEASSLPALSTRELDVLACVALGWTNPQIGEELGLTVETVKSYLRSATRKLGARTRLEAVVGARRHGLLP
ncbi:response regulator transcription factor [Streptomyces sp. NPDC055400]